MKTIALLHKVLGSPMVTKDMINSRQRKVLTDFVQTPYDEYELPDAYSLAQARAPASGEIFGILQQMKESFETNMANSQKEEMQSQKDYEALKAAKTEEVKAGQALIDTKTQEVAATDEKNAMSKQDLEDTRASLAADTEFMMTLKSSCQNVDQEFEMRTKARQNEIAAVSKALAFLSSDEAHDLFTRTFNPALLQKRATVQSKHRMHAAKVLREAAKKFNDPRLSE